ncbi:NmrA family NAD(P)-binding protein [Geodermatophilus marinus]|uniref:NmrA family NAD(P)-binding protein n=1 Tax=Geodermatophilus sp. LHW52908 TaxID=2303986 RepID=UPI000E3BEACD|nr:NAD(P)H-binding protein [Geodermatophilus sp. LHW52908]RFU22543.1 SDR family NAD(P)-dependent oxidoreductase [Geodermatophilus sp. LHW52908]
MIAVTGSTGVLGGRVARRLAAAPGGPPLRLVVRDPGRAPALPGAEVVAAPGGYADGPGLAAALTGVHTLYLVSAAEAEDRLQQHLSAVRAAADAGVQRVVYTSFVGAAPDAAFTLARQHAATEEALAATGVRATVLRHGMYADFVPFFATREEGRAVIAAPGGQGRAGFVSRDDLAEVGAAALLDDSPALDGAVLTVTGPQALTLAEAAAVLTEVTGVPTTYREQTVEEAWATRRPSGHPDWEVEGWVSSYLALAAGELAEVTDVVPRLTGHPARTLAEHLRAHPEDWAALRG